MAFVHGKQQVVLADGYDASPYLTDTSRAMGRDVVDVTTIAAPGDAKAYIAGQTDATVSLNGFYDSASVAGDQLWFDNLAAASAVTTIAPEGFTIGNRAIIHPNVATTYDVSSPVGGAVGFTVNQQGTQAASGIALHDVTAETGIGAFASVDDTGTLGSTSRGGVASLHITAATAMTAMTVIVQDSTNDSTWTDLITFTDFAVGGYSLVVAGNVDRYIRANVTVFTGTSCTFAVGFARF